MEQQLYFQPKRQQLGRGTGFKTGGNKKYLIGFLLVAAGVNIMVIVTANLFNLLGKLMIAGD